MPKYYLSFFLFIVFSHLSFSQKNYEYVSAPKDATQNVYFDTTISDPYQWMENPQDPRLQVWLEAEEKTTSKIKNRYLKTLDLKDQLYAMYYGVKKEKIEENIKKDSLGVDKYQFKYKTQNTGRFPNLLFRLYDKGNYLTLVDVKKLMDHSGDNIAVTGYNVNEAYDLVAVSISRNGSDWHELLFYNLKNGQQFHNTLKFVRSGTTIVWDKMNLYYDRYDEPAAGRELLDKAQGQKMYFHKFGNEQEQDKLLYVNTSGVDQEFSFFEMKDRLYFYSTFKHKNTLYKTLSVADKDSSSLYLKKFLVYPNNSKDQVSIEVAFGDKVLLKTNWGAPNGRVLLADINEPNKPIELVPEYDVPLRDVNKLGKDMFVCIYKNGNRDLALFFNLEGKLLNKIDFPEGKKVNYLYEDNEDAKHTTFCVSSFYHPNLWYQLNLEKLTFEPIRSVSVPYEPESLETRCVTYKSKDGTEIPMYITCLKKTKLNGENPTLLYGYGGYGTTVEPNFDESKVLWLLHGGILAVPNVRGGGAGGSEWGEAGRRLKKQNGIDDFIAAGEYLISQNYTSKEHLGSNGRSHGGLLVSAAGIQRPDLFKAVIAEAGPYDMLRFGKFTVGSAKGNINEFGDASNLEDFNNLKSYSPLHNIKAGVEYPNFLLMTGASDDRVPPLHTYKFLATLQEKASPESMSIMYVTPGAGHGGALTFQDWLDATLYKYAFLYGLLN
ncbi:prolyl oligopeptidase family serine peptidase [Formosa sp. L2A11]|uniref:prolyl oligopeptidase family serine peptidase n=1 Tax=Formosa sp. L2A11 TaxID=2686363 RepID=UPI00131AA6B5|nr:prolyl oligopeptidase family serine peptidase [Formosa sp. L2A11]